MPGVGIRGAMDGVDWLVGRAGAFGTLTPAATAVVERLEEAGKTVMLCWRRRRGAAGVIALRDELRRAPAAAVEALKRLGMHMVMLTGDNRQTAAAIGARAGVDEVRAGLLPDEKVTRSAA